MTAHPGGGKSGIMYKILARLEEHEIPDNGSVEPVVRTTDFSTH